MKLFKFIIYSLLVFSINLEIAQSQDNIASIFKSYNLRGNFLSYEPKENKFTVFYDARCKKAYPPMSTFDIVSTLIALETGIIRDSNYIFKWDSTHHSNPLWNKDLNIRQALENSCEPCFKELAKKISHERMQFFIEKFNYGETTFDSTLENNLVKFWKNGDLKISSYQQIYLLNNLYLNIINAKKKHIDILKNMLILESTPEYKLFGKLGTQTEGKKPFAWFIGWIESNNKVYFFALNFDIKDPSKDIFEKERKDLTLDIFKYMGIINK